MNNLIETKAAISLHKIGTTISANVLRVKEIAEGNLGESLISLLSVVK